MASTRRVGCAVGCVRERETVGCPPVDRLTWWTEFGKLNVVKVEVQERPWRPCGQNLGWEIAARSCLEPRVGGVHSWQATGVRYNPRNPRAGMARASPSCPHGSPKCPLQDLVLVARHSGYRVKGMACELGCSCRWLELFCHRQFALTPHAWLARLCTRVPQGHRSTHGSNRARRAR